ncbi:MAG: carboxypeptidase regulatory-like domain-containing protein [Candidatus Thorarchaeota archaeon]|nr:carboxypeptidase regulatory-like domain-containing protein [Candidatus Thorarchaeota archaeon]
MKHKHRILIYTVVLLGFLLAQNIILVEAFKPPPGDDPPPRTTYRIYGYVKKAGTNTPLSGATVKLYRGTTTYIGQKTTDSNGYYNFYYTTTSTITKCKSVASKSGYYTSSRIGYMLEGRVRLDHSLTQVPPPPPTAPTISNVEITEGITREVTVSWNVAWGTGATQYYVECYWGTDANLDSGNKIYYQAVSSTTTTF